MYAYGLSRQQPRLFEHADRFVAVSERHRAALERLGLPSEPTVTLPNFVPDAQFADEASPELGRYAFVEGRLVREKGFDPAVIAARAAGVPLVVAGDGPERATLQELASGGDVRFTGAVDQAELARLRAGASVAVVPSRSAETFGLAAAEAMAAGLPVAASRVGALPELVGEEGLVAPGDVGALAEAVTRLAGDAPVGERGLARVREVASPDAVAAGLASVYDD